MSSSPLFCVVLPLWLYFWKRTHSLYFWGTAEFAKLELSSGVMLDRPWVWKKVRFFSLYVRSRNLDCLEKFGKRRERGKRAAGRHGKFFRFFLQKCKSKTNSTQIDSEKTWSAHLKFHSEHFSHLVLRFIKLINSWLCVPQLLLGFWGKVVLLFASDNFPPPGEFWRAAKNSTKKRKVTVPIRLARCT